MTEFTFGKHKGRDVVEVMAIDPQYIQWLKDQAWLAEKHPTIYNTIINVRVSNEDAPTPEHNAMQVKFLDDELCRAVVRFVNPWRDVTEVLDENEKYFSKNEARWITKEVKIDHERKVNIFRKGIKNKTLVLEIHIIDRKMEVFSDVSFDAKSSYAEPHEWFGSYRDISFYMELKPSIGDDYPTVVRQINGQRRRIGSHRAVHILIYDQFSASGVTEKQMRQIFEEADIRIATLEEIESHRRK